MAGVIYYELAVASGGVFTIETMAGEEFVAAEVLSFTVADFAFPSAGLCAS